MTPNKWREWLTDMIVAMVAIALAAIPIVEGGIL